MSNDLIHKKMIEIMRRIDSIGKDQRNASQGFNYRGVDDIYNALHYIMADVGVYTTSKILNKSRDERTTKNGAILAFTCLTIEFTFHAEDGSSVSTEVEGEGMDSGDKSSNKAMAVADKYALLQAFKIPTKEAKDPDAESHDITALSPEDIKKADNFCKTIADMPTIQGLETFGKNSAVNIKSLPDALKERVHTAYKSRLKHFREKTAKETEENPFNEEAA